MANQLMKLLSACVAFGCAVGCGSPRQPERAPVVHDPVAEFAALEERLIHAETVRFNFHAISTGAFEADLRGALEIGPGDRFHLTASGHFGQRPMDLLITAEGDEFAFGHRADPVTAARPPHLREAVLIGLTRMGILHNLAILTVPRAPDRAEGGVRDWVTVGSLTLGLSEPDVLAFDITVAGRQAGSALLELDTRGRPVSRRQVVQFPGGEMQVVERYTEFSIEP